MSINNAKLTNAIKFSSKINAYIPSTIHDEEIDNTEFVNRVAILFSECFGGATSTNALGFWLSGSVGLIKEKTTIVFAYCHPEQLEQHMDKVVEEIEAIKVELKQEAMALEINGDMYFI